MKYDILESPHKDLNKEIKIYPQTLEFNKQFYWKIFEYMVSSYNKTDLTNFVFLEEVVNFHETFLKKYITDYSIVYHGNKNYY